MAEPTPEELEGAGLAGRMNELRDFSNHARERVARIILDICNTQDGNPALITAIVMSGLAGVADVMRAVAAASGSMLAARELSQAEARVLAAATLMVQCRVLRDGDAAMPDAVADFERALRRHGLGDLIGKIQLGGF